MSLTIINFIGDELWAKFSTILVLLLLLRISDKSIFGFHKFC